MKTLSSSAVETAIRNAARDAAKYEVEHFAAGYWFVTRIGDVSRMYWVDTNEGTCDCPAFERSGCCKHQKMVADVIDLERQEAEYEERYAAMGESADALERYWSR